MVSPLGGNVGTTKGALSETTFAGMPRVEGQTGHPRPVIPAKPESRGARLGQRHTGYAGAMHLRLRSPSKVETTRSTGSSLLKTNYSEVQSEESSRLRCGFPAGEGPISELVSWGPKQLMQADRHHGRADPYHDNRGTNCVEQEQSQINRLHTVILCGDNGFVYQSLPQGHRDRRGEYQAIHQGLTSRPSSFSCLLVKSARYGSSWVYHRWPPFASAWFLDLAINFSFAVSRW